ncbi:T20D4.11-like domain-containing protein [Caenorhabditis elegans]|uniref:T20D4.11-like domain-containing protein n=1 Tax=Caenorhabditis elegans TaxID=6239 RepID=Q9TXW1_CAEEL|nr:DUF19 domain-containing protein [Caenorhabditis elegans]CCD67818.1 DUF19 domain-containing protein [Caenorhabditis elegans]|eukprot:NP_503848.2 Uncharacterized protein CELE_Y73C8C.4 [Caenorhabditis elegans]
MRLSICWVIPLFTCFNYIESKSTKLNSSLNVCTQSEKAEINAKCTPYVNNLMNLTNEYSNIQVTSEIAKNINTTCNKIPTCFGQFNCTEAQKNKETYERKCEKIEFTYYEMMDCVSKIYALYYRGDYFCSFGINFLTKDPDSRRKSYVSGEECVKGIALRTKCDKKALEYLDSYYERFVDIMSTKHHGHSLFHELVSKRCDPVKDKMNEEIIVLKSEMKSSIELTTHEKTTEAWRTFEKKRWSKPTSVCDELKTCMKSSYFSEDRTNETVELCNVMYEDVFNLCLNEVRTREDAKTFPCFIDEKFHDPQNNTELLKNKECIQYVMTGMCGDGILTNFDINWDNYQKNTNSTEGNLI